MGMFVEERLRLVRIVLAIVAITSLMVISYTLADKALASPGGNLTIYAYTASGGTLREDNMYPTIKVIFPNGTHISGTWTSLHLTNISDGNYTVEVYWRDVKVYQKTVEIKNNTVTLRAYCNVTKVTLKAVDDENELVEDASIKVASIGSVPNGDTILLPFGSYTVSSVKVTIPIVGGSMRLDLTPIGGKSFEASGKSMTVIVQLPLRHSITISFYKMSGIPLIGGDYDVYIYYKVSGTNKKIEEVTLSDTNEIKLSVVPYGTYIIKVYIKGDLKLEETLKIDDKTKSPLTLRVGIISFLRFTFVDDDGYNLPEGLKVNITTPEGETLTLTLSDDGSVEISDAELGQYSYSLILNEVPTQGIIPVTETSPKEVYGDTWSIRVQVNARQVTVKVVDDGGAGLPPGLNIVVKYTNIVLANYTLNNTLFKRSEVRLDLGLLPTDKQYSIEVTWGGETLISGSVNAGSGINEYDLYFKHVSVEVLSSAGVRMSNFILNVTLHNGTTKLYKVKSEKGVKLRYLLGGFDYKVRVYWRGFEITGGGVTFDPKELKGETLKIKTRVGRLKVQVKGWFDRPIRGARVNLTLELENGTTVVFTAKTDSDGYALFPYVPLPGCTPNVLDAEIRARYSRFTSDAVSLIFEAGKVTYQKSIVMDVVLLIPGFPLSMMELGALIFSAVGGLLAAVFLYRRVVYQRELSEMLSETRPYYARRYEEYWEREGILSKIKERINLLRGGAPEEEEEEEEWSIFD